MMNHKKEAEKFYEDLQDTINQTPILGILGDFNTRVVYDATWSVIIGRHCPSERNENGDHLLDFCATNNLVVMHQYCTIFNHRGCDQYFHYHTRTSLFIPD